MDESRGMVIILFPRTNYTPVQMVEVVMDSVYIEMDLAILVKIKSIW